MFDEFRGAELLNVSVDIGFGQKDTLRIFEHDDIPLTVRNFFIKNNIANVSEEAFLLKVYEYLADLLEEHKEINKIIGKLPNCKSPNFQNPGERIYRESMQAKELKLIHQHMTRKDKIKPSTGKPEICKNSLKILTCRSSLNKLQTPTTNSQSNFTFTPRLNKKSQKIIKKSPNRIEDLYKDAEVRKTRQASAPKSEFSFRPKIKKKGKRDSLDVVERLLNSQKNKEKNIINMRKCAELNFDPETGQKLFVPVVGRAPDSVREGDVWQKLYSHKKQASMEFTLTEPDLEAKQESEKIWRKMKKERFLEIFNSMKPDSFGRINTENLVVKELGQDVIRVLEPLLKEFSEEKVLLSFSDFCDCLDKLMDSLNPGEKAILLERKKKPQIIHEKSRSIGDLDSFFKRTKERDLKAEVRMQIEKDKARMEEIKSCTFKPKTLKYIVKKK